MTEAERRLVVESMSTVADGVVVLTLTCASNGALPPWAPGAHIDLLLPNGLTRQYSLCGDPEDARSWRVAVLHEEAGRGGSRYVHRQLRAGQQLGARGPRNHFALADASGYLFIAGGIGITPILPMLHATQTACRPWRLLYGGRRRTSMAFLDQLEPLAERVAVRPEDEYGLLDLSVLDGARERGDTVFCCGPAPLIEAVEKECQSRGIADLHVERFVPQQRDGQRRGFDVRLERAGLTLRVPPDRSILQSIEDAGVTVPFSCREGTCGTCETFVVRGEPEHRDAVLSPAETASGASMMICVSRSLSDLLVLDI